MNARVRRLLTFPNVVSLTALFVALGGSSYAALRVSSKQIVDNSVRSKDIRNGELRGIDVRNGSLTPADFRQGTLTSIESRHRAYAVRVTDDGITLTGPRGSVVLDANGLKSDAPGAATGAKLPILFNVQSCQGPQAVTLGPTTGSAFVPSGGGSHSHGQRVSQSVFAC